MNCLEIWMNFATYVVQFYLNSILNLISNICSFIILHRLKEGGDFCLQFIASDGDAENARPDNGGPNWQCLTMKDLTLTHDCLTHVRS